MIYFTSDTHFGHENAIGFTERPYDTVAQMNKGLIDEINYWVGPDDALYHLGDFSFRIPQEQAADIRSQIKCKNVHLIPGNHDKNWSHDSVKGVFRVEKDICVIKDGAQKLILSHYPIADWAGKQYRSIHLHGHIHSVGPEYNLINRQKGILRYDVGVDANDYRPVSLEEIYHWFRDIENVQGHSWKSWI